MKNKRINLHIDQKRACVIMLSFALMLTFVGFFTLLTVGRDFSQLSSLLKSGYEYSVIANNTFPKDDYLKFDAGIGFSTKTDGQSSINAEILMQSSSSQYTELVDWNAKRLSKYGIAITKGISRQYRINVGDKLYSKHIVDGTIREYVIEQIIPEVLCIRTHNGRSITEGIIIMGYDSDYDNNLMHSNIIYTKTPIEELASSTSEMPTNIVYRTDELLSVTQKLIPYLLIILLLSVSITFGHVTSTTREVKYNIQRMIVLGFDKHGLDSSFRIMNFVIGFPAIVFAFVISVVIALVTGFSFAEGIFLLMELCVESLTILITTHVYIKRLWR